LTPANRSLRWEAWR